MVRPITKNIFSLQQKCAPATPEDAPVIRDLTDTLQAHCEDCVGMAANMIGVNKRIIAVQLGFASLVMVNPEITACSDEYETEEGCLSLSGVRKTKRFRNIEVAYLDDKFRSQKKQFHGDVAEIIQHEIDHCNGILI